MFRHFNPSGTSPSCMRYIGRRLEFFLVVVCQLQVVYLRYPKGLGTREEAARLLSRWRHGGGALIQRPSLLATATHHSRTHTY